MFRLNERMAKERSTMTINVHPDLAARFREVAANYDDRIGMCVSAAMLHFVEADPTTQGELIRRVFDATIRNEVQKMLDEGLLALADRVRNQHARKKPSEKQSTR